jgi:hypothetical protein
MGIEVKPFSALRDYEAAVELIIKELKGDYPLRENPHEIFCGQRSLLPHTLIFLQSRKLVQTALSASGVSKYDA